MEFPKGPTGHDESEPEGPMRPRSHHDGLGEPSRTAADFGDGTLAVNPGRFQTRALCMEKGTMMFGGQFNHRVIVDPVRNIVAKYGNLNDPGSGLESTRQEFSRHATRGESATRPGLPFRMAIDVPYLDRRQTARTLNRSVSVPRPE